MQGITLCTYGGVNDSLHGIAVHFYEEVTDNLHGITVHLYEGVMDKKNYSVRVSGKYIASIKN